jgi:hypothetical protein
MTTSRSASLSDAEVVEVFEQLAQYGVPAPGGARFLDIGTADFISFFETDVVDGLLRHGGATCKIFEGAYGSGKTHLLQLVHDLALDKGLAVVRTDLSDALGLEDWRLITQHVVQNIEVRVNGAVIRSLPRVLEALGRSGLINATRLSKGLLPHSGYGRAMTLAATPGSSTPIGRMLVSRFLQGERITATDFKNAGVFGVKQPLSAKNAEHVLRTVLEGLYRLGVPGTVLLFDEAERSFAFIGISAPRRIIQGANLLRRLIDASANGGLVATATVFAVLPSFVETCALAYPALGQRLQLNRDSSFSPGWRAPVLPVEQVTTEGHPRAFLEALVERMHSVIRDRSNQPSGSRERLLNAGSLVLEQNAGSGYRRALMKQLATLVLEEIA